MAQAPLKSLNVLKRRRFQRATSWASSSPPRIDHSGSHLVRFLVLRSVQPPDIESLESRSTRKRNPFVAMAAQSNDDKLMELDAPRNANDNSTWNFVQMNMTLLPIARPLPVSVSHRFQEGAVLAGVKPCTPTQKLLRQHTSNISPRRHDLDCSSSSRGLPPTPRSTCGAKRKFSETWHVPAIDTSMPPPAVLRMRSFSEDLYPPAPRSDSGYASDPARQNPSGCSPLHRNASLSSGCAAKGLYKGKRILELQDEDRRLHPDDRITAPSPSKRSKHQP
ncbi:hypothetical protein PF010_g6272 [Phytophthora fragariae]|uniref:Uncharacterized protein n=1 Tax=Phytophthora fragariae TaxID=53985 RepID=A0A6G0LKV2_9STRA|nr:hypothetical protein PF010_g6272 [Phytophthora fragariae]